MSMYICFDFKKISFLKSHPMNKIQCVPEHSIRQNVHEK